MRDTWNDIFTTSERPLASRLVVGTTFRCAARCPHCYLLQQNRGVFNTQTDMAPVLFQQLLASPFTRDLKSIMFTGGEALLNPNIFDWMDQAEIRGIADIRLVSNGLSLQVDKIVNRLVDQKNLKRLNISIDATTEEGYCRTKGIKQANFGKICEQIGHIADRFRDTRTKLSGSFVTQRFTADNTHRIVNFAQSIGLPNVQLTAFHNTHEVDRKSAETHSIEKYQAVIDQVVARTDYPINIMIQLPPELARKRFFCHSLAKYLCVSPNGTLAPCCHMPWDPKYGNFCGATDNPINHPAIVAMRNQFREAAASQDLRRLPEQCRHCNKRTPKNALLFNGDTRQWQKIYNANA